MGLYLIIFGTRGITYNHGQGNFYCPSCGESAFQQKRVRRFFTLYFLPVIPLNLVGEYVECGKCRGTYRPEVLELDPRKLGGGDFDAEFQLAIRRVMALMALADGVIEDSEVTAMREIYQALTQKELGADKVRAEIEAARVEGGTVQDYLEGIVGMLNDGGKELVVKGALMIAAADGEFQEEEKELILSIGKALQMSHAHLNGVIAEVLADGGEA